jgi:hypothetical protein
MIDEVTCFRILVRIYLSIEMTKLNFHCRQLLFFSSPPSPAYMLVHLVLPLQNIKVNFTTITTYKELFGNGTENLSGHSALRKTTMSR